MLYLRQDYNGKNPIAGRALLDIPRTTHRILIKHTTFMATKTHKDIYVDIIQHMKKQQLEFLYTSSLHKNSKGKQRANLIVKNILALKLWKNKPRRCFEGMQNSM